MYDKNDRVGIGDGNSFRKGTVINVARDGEVKVAWDDAGSGEKPMYYAPAALQLIELDAEQEPVLGFRLISTEGGSDA